MSGFAQILCWQAIGELLSSFVWPNIPGPVIGLTGLLLWLMLRGKVNTPLREAGASLRQHLGLMFVPAAAGIISFLPVLKQHWLAYLFILLVSMASTVAVSALVLEKWHRTKQDKV